MALQQVIVLTPLPEKEINSNQITVDLDHIYELLCQIDIGGIFIGECDSSCVNKKCLQPQFIEKTH